MTLSFKKINTISPLAAEILITVVIFIISLFYYLSYASYGFSESDWGGIIVAAERFLKGEVFYKDFSIVYTPGIYIYTALAFKILGLRLWSALAGWSIIRAINCLLFYLLSRRFFSLRVSLIFPFILWIIPGPIHKSFIVLFCLLHLTVYFLILTSTKRMLYVFAGIVAGISFIFRLDLLISFTLVLLVIEFIKLLDTEKIPRLQKIKGSLWNLLLYTCGVLLAISPLIIYLKTNSALMEAINQTLYFLGTARSRMFLLPPLNSILSWSIWDFSNYTVIFIPLAIAFLILYEIGKNIWSKKFDINTKQLVILLLHGILSLHQVLRWPWAGRLYQILPPFIIADIYLCIKWFFKHSSPINSRPSIVKILFMGITNLLLLLLVLGSLTMDDMYTNNSILIRLKNKTLLSYPRLMVYTTEKQAEDVKRLVKIIEKETKKDDYIYIVQYYPLYYFITDRRNATRYYFLEAYVYSDEKQREVIKDLEEKDVKLIISGPNHPGTPRATLLEDYLNKNFRIIAQQGQKIIYKRKTPI